MGQYAWTLGPDPEPITSAGAGSNAMTAAAAPAPSHSAHSIQTSPIASLPPDFRMRGAQPT
jgi:hypothetical protein